MICERVGDATPIPHAVTSIPRDPSFSYKLHAYITGRDAYSLRAPVFSSVPLRHSLAVLTSESSCPCPPSAGCYATLQCGWHCALGPRPPEMIRRHLLRQLECREIGLPRQPNGSQHARPHVPVRMAHHAVDATMLQVTVPKDTPCIAWEAMPPASVSSPAPSASRSAHGKGHGSPGYVAPRPRCAQAWMSPTLPRAGEGLRQHEAAQQRPWLVQKARRMAQTQMKEGTKSSEIAVSPPLR